GLLRDYIAHMVGFIVLLMFYTMFRFDAFQFSLANTSHIQPYMYLILAVPLISFIILPAVRSRMTGIILAGFSGFLLAFIFVVALIFIGYSDPDSVLRQLVVEIASVIMFMAVFYQLRNLTKEDITPLTKAVNHIVGIGAGLMVTLGSSSAFTFGQIFKM